MGLSLSVLTVSLTAAHAEHTIVYEQPQSMPQRIDRATTTPMIAPTPSTHLVNEPNTKTVATSTASEQARIPTDRAVREVPFYSQFDDIAWPTWQGRACGVANLAMVIDYYRETPPEPQTLLEQGVDAGHYIADVGWSHRGLVQLAERYGVTGTLHGFSGMTKDAAYHRLRTILANGPVIASVHNEFDPTSTIPHLVVVRDIRDGNVYYNDPAAGAGSVSSDRFKRAWKQRVIAMEERSRI